MVWGNSFGHQNLTPYFHLSVFFQKMLVVIDILMKQNYGLFVYELSYCTVVYGAVKLLR